ncbi:helix-turn-helix transcriptional regulator [Brevibacillus laterosporus]|uniref:helix-turn-helix domain-containing protein n=2 Tax=Brevibacillus laterosporus TaxID=1465 RepID=UPI0018CFECCD|nr:helix-turn-helix transcriptional regulator [Brevibacillus laterosporus]MBG9798345.1 DNA-binding protein [Brevibacillus laterosporus]MCR8939407.1 helix-turn-helix domain-containing protein [Brevibacillus laterosporus]MCZ0842047.1 helix-turn-helix transcriptional regulator [Brevibacillus laterosporus]MCZ0847237.1 helix-turn-helix transcriptional regulator [Brevibacillus laterosporus]MED1910335.1 helix-turn-helix transcriptional regulator [Brevibacillus laterosporus]
MNEILTSTTLGELIKEKREEFGITLSELSRRSGVSKGIISKIESGETKRPELRNLKLIADTIKIPYEEIIDRYIDVELRTDILESFLTEAIEIENISLLTKVAIKFLGNPKKDTFTLLERLYSLTATIKNIEVRLSLYNIIIKYARTHGVPKYIAKGLYQKYLIEREDLKRLEESFKVGEEGLHYIDFLSDDEKITFYFRMSLHAHNIKKYFECIELCEAGILLEEKDTELKARAYLAMINSYSDLHNYDNVESHLEVFREFEHDFVPESTKITQAVTKAKKKEFDIALPMLEQYMLELSKVNKIHVVNELLGIYSHLNITDSIDEIISKEEELLPDNPHTPYKVASLARYYRQKGAYQINKGLLDEGMDSYINSLTAYGEINALAEITKCLQEIFTHFSKISRPIDLQYVKKLEKAYNEIRGKN